MGCTLAMSEAEAGGLFEASWGVCLNQSWQQRRAYAAQSGSNVLVFKVE